VRYAMTGLGLGLIIGSVLSTVGANSAPLNFTGFGLASIAFFGYVTGLFLLYIALVPWEERSWAWKRRPTLRRLMTKAVTKADEDPEFRKRLKVDPRRTIEREFSVVIIDDLKITVLEETLNHVYAVVRPSKSSGS